MEFNDKEEIDIRSVIEFLKSDNNDLNFVRIPIFEISAKEFLSFAKSDFKENDEKGLINALSNAKRAISNRMDEMIKLSFLQKISLKDRWNVPTKMNKLSEIGIFVPSILQRKITSTRNLLEHEYVRPNNSQEVLDAIEIAELFLASTEKYIEFGLLGTVGSLGNVFIIFNIMSDKLEIYTKNQKYIIDVSKIDESDLIDLAKELTNLKSHHSSYSHDGDMNWDEYYMKQLNYIRKFSD